MEENVLKEICTFELFQGLNQNSYRLIRENGRIVEFDANYLLIKEKHEINELYFILDGVVSIYKINANGQKKVFYMLNKGCFLNEDLDNRPSSISAEIHIHSQLLVLPKEIVFEMMKNDFIWTQKILSSLSAKVRRLYRQLKNTPNSIRIEKKVAAKLYKLCKDYGIQRNNEVEINLQLSITFLADLLGSQRETVSRAVKKLQEMDLIYHKNRIFYVKDMNALARYFKS